MTRKPEAGDRVTVRYTFTLPETEPEGGFRLPPTLLSGVGTVVVQEAAATRDDAVGTVRRMRDTGVLVVKRVTPAGWGSLYTWTSLDATAGHRGAYADDEVCGHSDYIGMVPGYPTGRIALDADSEYWFELEPDSWSLGTTWRSSIGRAWDRHNNERMAFRRLTLSQIQTRYAAEVVTLP